MNLTSQIINNCPVPERILTKVKFGAVDSTRGNDSMNPSIDLDDYYYCCSSIICRCVYSVLRWVAKLRHTFYRFAYRKATGNHG